MSIQFGLFCTGLGLLSGALRCASAQAPAGGSPLVLDRVAAVVNNQTILASDIVEELHLAILEPGSGPAASLTSARALDRLISRALIQQQIRQQDAQALLPSQTEVDARIGELRSESPACRREKCATDAEWNAFLAVHHLTAERIQTYMRNRLEVLSFIEQRFRQGIRISPEQIGSYYRETLVPLYGPKETVPPLEKVSARIEEILLEQQVNALFDDWLKNLRSQGNIEVLDPALETGNSKSSEQGAGE